jgi:hypothetical protein
MNAILQRLRSKTYWFAGLLIGSGFLEAATGRVTDFIRANIPAQWQWAVAPVVGAAVIALREWTSKPLADK